MWKESTIHIGKIMKYKSGLIKFGPLGWMGYILRLKRDNLIHRRKYFYSNNEYMELVKSNK